MNVVFRCDGSHSIGHGHVIRCMTLAAALREVGWVARFVCREHEGDACGLIERQGFAVRRLPSLGDITPSLNPGGPTHSLGLSWVQDAEQTRDAVAATGSGPDWLVVDHYALDERWERAMRSSVGHIMVLDDLANRAHDCNLLLDQNYHNVRHARYADLTPRGATLLLGSRYALVRSSFAQHREEALARRSGQVKRLMVSMGGADEDNETGKVLAGVALLGHDLAVDVVVGASCPHEEEIRALCTNTAGFKLYVQTDRMADLMTHADLAITGGGSTTWERCVVGLPAIVAIRSEDQAAIATAVDHAGGHRVLGWSRDVTAVDYERAVRRLLPEDLLRMSRASARLCDGKGSSRIVAELQKWG